MNANSLHQKVQLSSQPRLLPIEWGEDESFSAITTPGVNSESLITPRSQPLPVGREVAVKTRQPSSRIGIFRFLVPLMLLCAFGFSERGFAQAYSTGSTVTNDFTFVARYPLTLPSGRVLPAGSTVRLSDFAGSIVFFEWFAAWCPYCQAAAPQVVAGIEQYYGPRGGNPYGVPVVVIDVNQESSPGYTIPTDNFFSSHGITNVVNDYTATVINPIKGLFTPGGGQPLFVCINCVSNSPTTPFWNVMVDSLNYGQTEFSSTLAGFRTIIDTVRPRVTQPRISSPARTNTVFSFSVTTQPGLIYRVQYSTNMTAWLPLTTINGSNTVQTVRHTNAPAARAFYRLVTP